MGAEFFAGFCYKEQCFLNLFFLLHLAASCPIPSLETVSTAFYTELCSFVQHIVQWPLQLLKKKYKTNSLFSFSSSGLLVSQEDIRIFFFSWGKSSSAYPSLCSVPPCKPRDNCCRVERHFQPFLFCSPAHCVSCHALALFCFQMCWFSGNCVEGIKLH